MNNEYHRDRLIDMLLSERIGGESPPDVRERVLAAAARPLRSVPAPSPKRVLLPVKRSRSVWFAIAAMAALLAVAGGLLKYQRISIARTPVVTSISGTVNPSGGRIVNGESLQVGDGSQAVLRYADGTVVEVGSGSSLRVAERPPWDHSKVLELTSGSLEAKVSPQPRGRPMVLISRHADATVVGTSLKFTVNDDRSLLEVEKGAVRFLSHSDGRTILVESRRFAESGESGFRQGDMSAPGIRSFTLMNADTDQPIRMLTDVETISLASLPTPRINIRADYDGATPKRVEITATRADRSPTGLPPHASEPHLHPPYFIAGDHWADGRPDDCVAWTPQAGAYRFAAVAFYQVDGEERAGPPLAIKIRFTR